jgi:hypothetical protein
MCSCFILTVWLSKTTDVTINLRDIFYHDHVQLASSSAVSPFHSCELLQRLFSLNYGNSLLLPPTAGKSFTDKRHTVVKRDDMLFAYFIVQFLFDICYYNLENVIFTMRSQ